MDKKSVAPIDMDIARRGDPEQSAKFSFGKVTGVITTIAAIFGIGYGVGQFKQGLDFKLEKLEMKQECAEKLQTALNNCREAKIAEYEGTVNDLRTFVKEYKEQNAKK